MTVMEFEKHSLQFELINRGIDTEIILNDINSYDESSQRFKKREGEKDYLDKLNEL